MTTLPSGAPETAPDTGKAITESVAVITAQTAFLAIGLLWGDSPIIRSIGELSQVSDHIRAHPEILGLIKNGFIGFHVRCSTDRPLFQDALKSLLDVVPTDSRSEMWLDFDITMNFSQMDMRGWNLSYISFFNRIMWGVLFQGANLDHADFRFADLRMADFSGVDLTHTNLQGAGLQDAIGIDDRREWLATEKKATVA